MRRFLCEVASGNDGKISSLTCHAVEQSFPVETGNNVTRYIKGDAPNGGNGTQSKPWNSFSQAEGATWDTLIILPSTTPIDGGLTLKDGQKVQGRDRNLSLIQNTNINDHNGDVFVSVGDNTICNLTIVTAARSGIDGLLARNLTVADVSFEGGNTANVQVRYDYGLFSATVATVEWFGGISFFGGPTVISGIQPYNKISGAFVMDNCYFGPGFKAAVVGSGDSIATGFVNKTYVRTYTVTCCTFDGCYEGFVAYASGGGRLSGSIKDCTFQNIKSFTEFVAPSIYITMIRANNPNFPGRGNYRFGTHTVDGNLVQNSFSWGCLVLLNGNETGNDSKVVVQNNTFIDNGVFGNTPPAVVEFGAAAIQMQSNQCTSGNTAKWVVCNNTITDSSGLAPSISTYFLGGSQGISADIQGNKVSGTTTGIDILYYNVGVPNSQAKGDYYIANNEINNVDSVLFVGSNDAYTNLRVKVEKNCFDTIGARNTPSLQDGSMTSSYYGGAVIIGAGGGNVAGQIIGQTSEDLGNAIVDFGKGSLGSSGNNSFTNVTGAHFWVGSTLTVLARNNFFDRTPEIVCLPSVPDSKCVDTKNRLKNSPVACSTVSASQFRNSSGDYDYRQLAFTAKQIIDKKLAQ